MNNHVGLKNLHGNMTISASFLLPIVPFSRMCLLHKKTNNNETPSRPTGPLSFGIKPTLHSVNLPNLDIFFSAGACRYSAVVH